VTKRILSSIVLWLSVFAALWFFRAAGAVALVTLISALALREFYRIQEASGYAPFGWFGMLFGALITAAPWLEVRFGWPSHPLLALAVVLVSIRILGERPPERRASALASTVFGLVYVGLLLQYLVRIATPLPGDVLSPDGRLILCVWLVAVAKFCDTGALLTGLAAGRRRMAPTISPKKTWEGAFGGVAAAALVGALVAWLGRAELPPLFTPLRAAVLAVPIAIVAIVSDLVESVVKRQASVKDSGGAIPGIGGILDMIDSVLLVAPVGYFLLGLR
jgi:phosphatidate cytidylyltransferase